MDRFVRSDRQETAPVGDGLVVLELDSGESWTLNAVGTAVWELLAEPRTPAELCDSLTERFDVERDRCAADVADLLAELGQARLIQPVDS